MAAQVQNAIPEAIAFVVSNRDGTEPIFRITPEGMLMRKVLMVKILISVFQILR